MRLTLENFKEIMGDDKRAALTAYEGYLEAGKANGIQQRFVLDSPFDKWFKKGWGLWDNEHKVFEKTFTFFWKDGKREVVQGKDAADAATQRGYSNGAMQAMDFYAHGDNDEYDYNRTLRIWVKKVQPPIFSHTSRNPI